MAHPSNIAVTPQTDERNFPKPKEGAAWGQSGHPWPKAINREFMPEDVEPWQKAHMKYDRHAVPSEYWDERCPRPRRVLPTGKIIYGEKVPVKVTQDMVDHLQWTQTVGEDVQVNNKEEETRVREFLKLGPAETEQPKTLSMMVEPRTEEQIAKMREENERLEAELERNVRLRQKLSDEKELRQAMESDNAVQREHSSAEKKKKGGWVKGRPRGKKVVENLGDVSDAP